MEFQLNMQAMQVKETVSIEQMGTVVITGLVVVFVALILLVLLVSLFGKFFSFASRQKKTKPISQKISAPTQKDNTLPVVEEGIREEVIAVITAAISALNSDNNGITYSLKSIKKTNNSSRQAWSNAGIIENSRPF